MIKYEKNRTIGIANEQSKHMTIQWIQQNSTNIIKYAKTQKIKTNNDKNY